MEKYFFLPCWFKWIGFPLLVLAFLLVVWLKVDSGQSPFIIGGLKISEGLAYTFLLLALLVIFFSKEKSDNRFMSQLKTEALVVAVGINYLILIVGLFLYYDSWDLLELLCYNICSLFLLWLLIFYFKKRSCKGVSERNIFSE